MATGLYKRNSYEKYLTRFFKFRKTAHLQRPSDRQQVRAGVHLASNVRAIQRNATPFSVRQFNSIVESRAVHTICGRLHTSPIDRNTLNRNTTVCVYRVL